jgi:hypothetical protein
MFHKHITDSAGSPAIGKPLFMRNAWIVLRILQSGFEADDEKTNDEVNGFLVQRFQVLRVILVQRFFDGVQEGVLYALQKT